MIRFTLPAIALAAGVALGAAPDQAAGRRGGPEPLVEQVRTAIDTGVRFLRKAERGRGHWEIDFISAAKPGGSSSLALLALLNCGIKPDDPIIQRGLEHLRKVEPQSTYVVGLQTMVFAEVGDAKDGPRIQRNVDWLIRARVMSGPKLRGWGYGQDAGGTDYSNSQYALSLIHI
jgi:hypothetical protein